MQSADLVSAAVFPRLLVWLRTLASLRLTLIIIVVFALSIGIYYFSDRRYEWILAMPLTLLAINLSAAIVTHPTFRYRTPLLLFHLALLMLLLLVVAGRLSYLRAEVEVTSGSQFAGSFDRSESGPLHQPGYQQLHFLLHDFTIHYAPGIQREETEAQIEWRDDSGRRMSTTIGDHHPLRLNGYRFYTTPNKGFAALFLWQPTATASAQRGTVHFPAYPAHEFRQAQRWVTPDLRLELWGQLDFDEILLDPEHPSQFRLPQQQRLTIRTNDKRYSLQPGESISLPQGTLRYEGLRKWMGFKVFYDWTLPWLLACGVVAVLSLGWHYWRIFSADPWLREGKE
ncbi:MAG: cytochrome c biogenesis protein ResB [Chromatiales bacterium]|nr:cytochrome c biogenesis protein ResB [Chromatiales bacterium]